MTQIKGQTSIGATVALMVIATISAAWAALSTRAAPDPAYSIVIIAKDMMFTVLDGQACGQPNPTLQLDAGRPVTILFRNEDAGMLHDLAFESLEVRSRRLSYGQEQQLTFMVPKDARNQDYFCSLHPQIMRGQVLIDPNGPSGASSAHHANTEEPPSNRIVGS